MPTKKRPAREAQRDLPSIPQELIDQFVSGPMSADAIQDAAMAFKKALIERALGAEMGHHLGYPQGAERPEDSSNQRNGRSSKTVLTEDGPLRLDIPRDRDGSFAPILIPKHERRFTGFDDKIIAMYARGMSVREIRAFLSEQYGTDVSHDFISSVTDAVLEEVSTWQQRPLEPMYPVIFFDALRVKIRDEGVVRNKAIYLALGVLPDGTRDILGIWIENTEGAKFWMKVFNDLKTRGVEDVLIAVTDGLKGMPEALSAVFPETTLQTCIVHLIRNSLDYAAWDKRRELAKALKPISSSQCRCRRTGSGRLRSGAVGQAVSDDSGGLETRLGAGYPIFRVPPAIRKVIYTTNAIESINSQLRKIIKTRGHFPTDEAATKLIWLALKNITANWGSAAHDWKSAMNQFAVLYGDRFIRPNW
ncbi:IS256 family transposase [Pseudomonas sp. S150]|uniref:IS256 family transposase n=1 Tax=Pseudomonas sp. S150 TaxID=2559074 RepID=UPI002113EEED|nr:IS256 family transposase [Pseudomonas sp. S150]